MAETTTKDRIVALIQADEGYAEKQPDGSCKAYQCPAGKWTIGYGTNLEAIGYTKEDAAKQHWPHAKAERYLLQAIADAMQFLDKNFPAWRGMTTARQAVVISGVYQLGQRKALEFKQTIAHIKAMEYDQAADHMLASRWATQTPARVKRLAQMMRTGEWPK